MSTEPASTSAESPEPPAARRIRHERTFHGDTFVDEYAWLADKDNPETIAFLEAENAYTEAMTAGQAELREAIFGEIKARTQETDLSVPTRKGGWWYYARTVEGKQYAVFCRRAVRPDDAGPPMSADGSPLDGEEVLLDGNELAGDGQFFAIGAYSGEPGRPVARVLHRLLRRRALHPAGQGPGDGRDGRRRDPGHVLRRGLVAGRLGAVLHHGRRRLAAVPGVAAHGRHAPPPRT